MHVNWRKEFILNAYLQIENTSKKLFNHIFLNLKN